MAATLTGLAVLLDRVPSGKSLHIWSDGHCSFEDKYDGSSEVASNFAKSPVMGTWLGSGDGGFTFADLVRAIDRLEGQGVSDGRGDSANVGGSPGVGRGEAGGAGAAGGVAAGSSGNIQRDHAACVAGSGTRGQGAKTTNDVDGRGPNWARNREWKETKRAKKAKKKATVPESSVPEWRRKDVRAMYHTGAFADCSDATKKELRETRAQMLVAKNRAEASRAAHEQRRLDARLRCRLVEEEVEVARIETGKKYEKSASEWYKRNVDLGDCDFDNDAPAERSRTTSVASSVSVEEFRELKQQYSGALDAMKAELKEQSEFVARAKEENAQLKKAVQDAILGNTVFEAAEQRRRKAAGPVGYKPQPTFKFV